MSYRRRAPAFRPSLSRRAELGLGGEKEEEEEAFFICEVRRGAACGCPAVKGWKGKSDLR